MASGWGERETMVTNETRKGEKASDWENER